MPRKKAKPLGRLPVGAEVTCASCGRTYRCKPGDDYYNNTRGSTTDGVCKGCLVIRQGDEPAE